MFSKSNFHNILLLLVVTTTTRVLAVDNDVRHKAIDDFKIMEGHKVLNDYTSPLPFEYIKEDELPKSFTWGDVNGKSYLTKSLNQHLPQYCGSCWAHGAMSALADRIKIARKGLGDEINLSIQYILNCGTDTAGSCHGGSHSGAYEFVKSTSGYVPFDTCLPYIACSDESTEGFCGEVDTQCHSANICRTCDTFAGMGGSCVMIDTFPNATIAEYGSYHFFESDKVHKIKAEIYARGPVAAGVNAEPIVEYKGGVVKDRNILHKLINHVVSIVGWGVDEEDGTEYWIVRNSWGQYWGEMGYFRVETGHNSLGIEGSVVWATPKSWTVKNTACYESGSNCQGDDFLSTETYTDPSKNLEPVGRRLRAGKL
jgi:cathepsin X